MCPKARKRGNDKGEQAQTRVSEFLAPRRYPAPHGRRFGGGLRLVIRTSYEQERSHGAQANRERVCPPRRALEILKSRLSSLV